MIKAVVRSRSVSTTRSAALTAKLNAPDGKAAKRLQVLAAEATSEAKRLMEAELRYPRRPSDTPPLGKERRRRDEHLIDTIRSTVVKSGPNGPRISITAHPDFRFLENGTDPHVIQSPGHPQSSYTAAEWSVKWSPTVWHTPDGQHQGPGGAWVGEMNHPGTRPYNFLRRAVRHAIKAT